MIMKKTVLLMVMMLTAVVGIAKNIKTVVLTTTPIMHCESCENKIKGNLRFAKGVKQIETNIAEQTVTVSYDADKTTPAKLAAAFGKFGYKAKEVNALKNNCKKDGADCCKATSKAQSSNSDCCK